MICTGDTIENPITGERLRFLATSRDTGGESVVVECTIQPDGAVAAAHVHPKQSELFEVLEGTVAFKLGRKTVEKHAGESVLVEAGTAHKFWNAGSTPARFVTTVRPALQFERLADAIDEVLAEGLALREAGVKDAKAFKVHKHLGEPCPQCGTPIARVDFEEHTIFYCPTCQTGGRTLKDRRLSRLLR